MSEFVPEDVRALIERIEAKRGEEHLAKKRAAEAELARRRKIEELRQERETDIRVAVKRIERWIERFEETVGSAVWQLEKSVVLFSAKFWRGEPCPPGDVACSAQLRLHGPEADAVARLAYEELHKGRLSASQPLLGVPMLQHAVHPLFVIGLDAHLAGPDAWKFIRLGLERLDRQLAAI